jgi:hypothetical protein
MPSLFDKVPQTLSRDALGSLSKSALIGSKNAVGIANKTLSNIVPGSTLKDITKSALEKDEVILPDTVDIPDAKKMKRTANAALKAAAEIKNAALAANYKGVLESIQSSALVGANNIILDVPSAGVGKEAGDFLRAQGYTVTENIVNGEIKMTVRW